MDADYSGDLLFQNDQLRANIKKSPFSKLPLKKKKTRSYVDNPQKEFLHNFCLKQDIWMRSKALESHTPALTHR